MGIIIFAAACAAAVAGIAIAALAISAKVLKEPETPDGSRQKENLSEWDSLARSHDPAKAKEAMKASSEAYRILSGIYSELEASLPGSLKTKIGVKDPAALASYTVESDFWPGIDAAERRDYLAWSRAREKACRETRDRIDLGCAMGAMADSQKERAMCMELAGDIYGLLDTGIELRLETMAEDGVHKLWKELRIEAPEIVRMAGGEPGKEPEDMLARFRILKAAGFRCSLCGRSPVSGGKLFPAKDAITGEDTCLCEGCYKG